MSDDEDYSPESDPYCAHWWSVFEPPDADAGHPAACEACGHPCTDHPALWGCPCQICECDHFESRRWPAEDISPPKASP